MNSFQIKRRPDPLTEETWTFVFFDDRMRVVLDGYCRGTRLTTRHKTYDVTPSACYSRLGYRRADMTETDVPMPEDVVEEARRHVVDRIKVVLWDRDYRGR